MSVELKEIQMKEIELLEMMGITQPCPLMERKRKMLRKTKTQWECVNKREERDSQDILSCWHGEGGREKAR